MVFRKASARRSALLFAVLVSALLCGCAGGPVLDADLSARSKDPAGLVTGLPAQGETVCIASGAGNSSEFDLALRRALHDHGYRAVFLQPAEEPDAKRCRFFLALTGARVWTPGDLPARIALDYRDLYTGETQRAVWRRTPAEQALRRQGTGEGTDGAPNPLVSGLYGDVNLIMRHLVDQLFPFVH